MMIPAHEQAKGSSAPDHAASDEDGEGVGPEAAPADSDRGGNLARRRRARFLRVRLQENPVQLLHVSAANKRQQE